MKIGPRTGEVNTRHHRYAWREINGTRYHVIIVKVSRLGRPYVAVTNADTGTLVRCTCLRADCPVGAKP